MLDTLFDELVVTEGQEKHWNLVVAQIEREIDESPRKEKQ